MCVEEILMEEVNGNLFEFVGFYLVMLFDVLSGMESFVVFNWF